MGDTELLRRLAKLERDNRRFKRLGFAALVLAVAMGSVYATRSVPDVIKAHEFDVVDGAGNVRAEMRMNPVDEPDIAIFSPRGRLRGSMYLTKDGSSQLSLYGKKGIMLLGMGVNPDGSRTILFGQNKPKLQLSLGMEVTAGGQPNITLIDGQGYMLQLGSTVTVSSPTGTTQQTSADSIVMFGNGKRHRVIWKAP